MGCVNLWEERRGGGLTKEFISGTSKYLLAERYKVNVSSVTTTYVTGVDVTR